jgi:hypothetical protein
MLVLFLDESGDHSLDKIDPQYPVFVLGGCIVDLEYHDHHMTSELKRYKNDLFGRDDFILHTADIARRRGVFQILTNKDLRDRFYQETNRLMASLDYTVMACCIKKEEHLRLYGLAAMDPYMLSLKILVERFVMEIKAKGGQRQGIIIAEARDETLDNQLRLSWMDLRTGGTEYISASDVRKHISELQIRDKSQNIAGLQIADFIVSPIGRHIIGKTAKMDWNIIKQKFRRAWDGRYKGFGLVVLPKKREAAPE